MRQKSKSTPVSSEGVVRDIRRATRKHHAVEEKIRIVLDRLRGATSMAELCRREGIAESIISAVRELLGERITTNRALREQHSHGEESITPQLPDAVAFVESTEEISRLLALCHRHGVPVVPFGSDELGIRWAVLGAVQRTGDNIRINVSLTDLSTGGDIWSDRFEGDRANLPDLQNQIVVRLARSLSVELIQAESHRSLSERSSNPDAADLAMRGRTSVDHGTAFDIAGKGLANEQSLVEAIEYAERLAVPPQKERAR